MTKGITGIHIPPPRIGSLQFDTEKTFYWITIVFVVLGVGYAREPGSFEDGTSLCGDP